jgi:acylphosphatase
MVAKRLEITGRVQGVGFRYSMQSEAARRGVSGWVRNRRDGSVEALLQGEDAAVEALVAWARQGPAGALVTQVRVLPADGEQAVHAGFELRPTL